MHFKAIHIIYIIYTREEKEGKPHGYPCGTVAGGEKRKRGKRDGKGKGRKGEKGKGRETARYPCGTVAGGKKGKRGKRDGKGRRKKGGKRKREGNRTVIRAARWLTGRREKVFLSHRKHRKHRKHRHNEPILWIL